MFVAYSERNGVKVKIVSTFIVFQFLLKKGSFIQKIRYLNYEKHFEVLYVISYVSLFSVGLWLVTFYH